MAEKKNKFKHLKEMLFGSVDRVYAFVSIVFTIISILLTVYSWIIPRTVPALIIVRDLIIFFVLIGLLAFFVFKYYRNEKQFTAIHNHLHDQLEYTNHIIQGSIQEIYERYKTIFLSSAEILVAKEEHKVFEEICRCVTQDVRDSFIDYFEFKGVPVRDDISVSVKLILSPKTIQKLFGKHFDDRKDMLHQKDQWVITAFRDPETYNKNKPIREGQALKREVISSLYSIEANTAFRDIFIGHNPHFCHNNLLDQYEKKDYQNENTNFRTQYNSTLVVPLVLGKSHKDFKYLGFLAVDSLNPKGLDLFDTEVCYQILNHAACALSNYYLALVLYHDLEYSGQREE